MNGRHRLSVTLTAVAVAALAATATLAGQRGVGPPPPPPPPPPELLSQTPVTGTGAISGVVVDGARRQPIAGAVVSLGGGVRGSLPSPSRVTTDSKGRYVFTRLPAGNYSLAATNGGYETGRFGDDDPDRPVGLRAVQLADAQWFADGRILMWRTGAISGTVTDEAGEPQVGLVVRVIERVILAGQPQLASGASAKTDDLGHYRVAGLASGSYVVFVPSVQAAVPGDMTLVDLAGYTPETMRAAEAAGRQLTPPDPAALVADASTRLIPAGYPVPPAPGGRWMYPPTFYPGARTIAEAATVDLRRGEQRAGIDVGLAPVRGVVVRGVVQSPTGTVPAHTTLRLLPLGNEALGFGSETATALIGADGTFALPNVPAGRYTIVVSRTAMEYMSSSGSLYGTPAPPGCVSGGSGFFTLGSGPGSLRASYRSCGGTADDALAARMPLTVGDADMPGVVVPFARSMSISGRFVFEGGPPAADSLQARIGTQVFAEPANGDASLGLPTGRNLPGDLTQFKVTGLLQGAYVLRLGGPVIGQVKSVEWQGRDFTGRPFDMTSGRDITGVVVTFTSAAARIRGSVRDQKGAAAASGAVVAFPTDRSLWTNYGLRPDRLALATISTSGAYSLNLPAGEYFVVAIDTASAKDWTDPRFLAAASTAATRVTVGWGETPMQDLTMATVKVAR